ncbi:MAG: hypothetical protein PHG16_07535 [Lachnospiraceae bacterium]|nr:hypothetical protein [Lachnospiraceae bacterium]
MNVIGIALASCFIGIFVYSMAVTGKVADQRLQLITENSLGANTPALLEDKMESQREIVRKIEQEIKKGSSPLHFEQMGFGKDTYHLVESHAKLDQLLDYFFRNGEYAALADRQVKSNVYMDGAKKKPVFRSAKSELDRRNMEISAKRWIKKKHPTFDGDVYVENVRCFLAFPKEEIEKRKCVMDGEETTAMIFSKKHLEALYLQCLINRKEVMLHQEMLEGFSEVCNRIYRLEDVDVLFQCLLMDNMDWQDNRLYVQFSTMYLLKNMDSVIEISTQ